MSHSLFYRPTYVVSVLLLVASLVGVAALSVPSAAQAKTVSASDTYTGELWYRNTTEPYKQYFSLGLENPHATVHYQAQVRDLDTGNLISDGASVPVGTEIEFVPNLGDISWVGTGRTNDTPTGSWVTNAVIPNGECSAQNYVGYIKSELYDQYNHLYANPDDNPFQYHVYIPFSVHLPDRTVNVTGTASLTALGGNRYRVDGPGTIAAEFNFASTYGQYYYEYKHTNSFGYTYCRRSWGNVPMLNKALIDHYPRYTGPYAAPNNPAIIIDHSNFDPYIYQAQFAARTITYNLTATSAPDPSNTAPSDPSINGAPEVTVGTPYTFDFVSSDADGDDVYYEIDWDQDGTADQRVPSAGVVSEGVSQSGSRIWPSAGSRSFAVRAVDAPGAASGWSTWSVNVNAAPATLSFETAVNGGSWSASDQTVGASDTVDLRWSTTNMTNCTGTNFSTGGATNNAGLGVSTPSPGTTETFTLDCTTNTGTTQSASLNITTTAVPLPTVTVSSRVNGGPWQTGNQTVNSGQTVEMEWSSTNAASCTGNNVPGLSGTAGTSGVSEPAPGSTDTYGATCFNSAGDPASDTFSVTTVAPPACSDSTDNDADGFTDYPNDPSCTSADDDDESPQNCSDPAADNYQAAGACTYPTLIDLEGVSLNPSAGASYTEGDTITFSGRLDNNGPSDLATGVWADVEFDTNNDGIADQNHNAYGGGQVTSLSAGNSAALSYSTNSLTPGTYRYRINVDTNDLVSETNEGNNTSAWRSFEVETASLPACSDGIDNDADGFTDYPDDPSCTSADDDDERGFAPSVRIDTTDYQYVVEVGDTKTIWWDSQGWYDAASNCTLSPNDLSPYDTGDLAAGEASKFITGLTTYTYTCTDPDNNYLDSERSDTLTLRVSECSDEIDNDGDGNTDYPDDPSCSSSLHDDESTVVPPELTANPRLVRAGNDSSDDVTLTWTLNGNEGCQLSSNTGFGAVTSDGSGLVEDISSTQTYTITCDGGMTDEVTVQVLPQIFES